MAVQFPDPIPTANSNDKTVHVKVVQLTAAAFSTTGTLTHQACILPADATILTVEYWKKTQFSGGGVTAASLSIGIPGTPTYFASAIDVFTPVAGTVGKITPMTNIMQPYNIPYTNGDIYVEFTGSATTGNPTAGELEVAIYFVR